MHDEAIHWLHVSDFHAGKIPTAQDLQYEYLLRHIKEFIPGHFTPHFVFVTGDIANKGKQAEYLRYREKLLNPLHVLLPNTRYLAVPGNHDLNHNESPYVTRDAVKRKADRFCLCRVSCG